MIIFTQLIRYFKVFVVLLKINYFKFKCIIYCVKVKLKKKKALV